MSDAPLHLPVLLAPAVASLVEGVSPARLAAGVWVDGTFGRGGHSQALLARLGADAQLHVFDRDPEAIAVARQLAAQDPRVHVHHEAFGELGAVLTGAGLESIDGLLLDVGVSSPQIDDAQRGFSFMRDGPLDMRMDPTRGLSAADWLASVSVEQLQEVITRYGEERFARSIAAAIAARREVRPLTSTLELADLVASAVRTREKGQHPATRTFQALRIFINQELEELARALSAALALLRPDGRLAVISFHSLEDRLVKQFLQAGVNPDAASARLPIPESQRAQPLWRHVRRVLPDAQEVAANPRARSAVLRVAERTSIACADPERFLPPPLLRPAAKTAAVKPSHRRSMATRAGRSVQERRS